MILYKRLIAYMLVLCALAGCGMASALATNPVTSESSQSSASSSEKITSNSSAMVVEIPQEAASESPSDVSVTVSSAPDIQSEASESVEGSESPAATSPTSSQIPEPARNSGESSASAASVESSEVSAPASSSQTSEMPVMLNLPDDSFLADVEHSIIKRINKIRSAQGLPELQISGNLRTAARIRSRELVQNNLYAHTRPDGSQWYTILKNEMPVQYQAAGENLQQLTYGGALADLELQADLQAKIADGCVESWQNSESHNALLTDGSFTASRIGLGVYYAYQNNNCILMICCIMAD